MTDVEELEKIYALDAKEPEVTDETETKDEWISACATLVGGPPGDLNSGKQCPHPAVVNMTLVCPFCGADRTGKCEEHFLKGIKGELWCLRCSAKAKTEIYKTPISCVWKDES